MRFKKFISGILICMLSLMVFSFAGCSKSKSGKKVVFVKQESVNAYFDGMSEIFKKQIEAAGYSYEDVGTEEWGTSFQAELFKEVVDTKPAAIIVAPLLGEDMYNAFRYANEKDVPIILVDTDIDRELLASAKAKVSAFVGVDNYEGGKMAADYIAGKIPEGSKVAIISGPIASANSENRCDGFRDQIRAKGMEVAGELTADWNEVEGYSRGKLILEAHPEIKAVFTANSSIFKGISKAAEELGITLYGATFDKDDTAEELINEGKLLFVFDQNLEGVGKAIVEAVDQLSAGKELEPFINSGGTVIQQ